MGAEKLAEFDSAVKSDTTDEDETNQNKSGADVIKPGSVSGKEANVFIHKYGE